MALAILCLLVAGCASQSSIDGDVSDNELRRQIDLEDAREEFLMKKEICTQRGGVMRLPVRTTRVLGRRYNAMDYRRARCR